MPCLRILTGPNTTQLTPTLVNTGKQTTLTSTAGVSLFLRRFTGLPPASPTHPLFEAPPHDSNLFSIRYTFIPSEDINGDSLVLANTFDQPIRDSLPYFFSAAWSALKLLDPGLDGDVYADKPFVHGPVLSSVQYIRISSLSEPTSDPADTINEDMRLAEMEIPPEPSARRKWFLDRKRREEFVFKKGVRYQIDFANGYIDFNDFTLALPGLGWKISVLKYWDGQPFRYELFDRRKMESHGVVQFEVVTDEELEKENEKPRLDSKDID